MPSLIQNESFGMGPWRIEPVCTSEVTGHQSRAHTTELCLSLVGIAAAAQEKYQQWYQQWCDRPVSLHWCCHSVAVGRLFSRLSKRLAKGYQRQGTLGYIDSVQQQRHHGPLFSLLLQSSQRSPQFNCLLATSHSNSVGNRSCFHCA